MPSGSHILGSSDIQKSLNPVPREDYIKGPACGARIQRAPNCLAKSNRDVSDNRSEEAGFISRQAFDKACQALMQRCPGSGSSDINLDTRVHVRPPCPSAPFGVFLISSFAQRGKVCIVSPNAEEHLGRPTIPQNNTSSKRRSPSTNTIRSDEALRCARFLRHSRV